MKSYGDTIGPGSLSPHGPTIENREVPQHGITYSEDRAMALAFENSIQASRDFRSTLGLFKKPLEFILREEALVNQALGAESLAQFVMPLPE